MSLTAELPKICLIGLGQMGTPVSSRLIEAGFAVSGVDKSAEARDRLTAIGGRTAISADEAAVGAECIITLLPNGKIVHEALLGDRGALSTYGVAASRPAPLVIDMSSSAPSDTVSLGRKLAAMGIEMVDAPVSGGVKRAVEGSLTVMLGGEPRACDRAIRFLSPVASNIRRTGPLGSGHAMKALNNFVSASGTVAAMEALLVGERFGIEADTIIDVLNGSSGRNNATEVKMKQFVLSGTFASGFATGLMAKDVAIAASMAEDLELSVPMLQGMADLWRRAALSLGDRSDHTEMVRFLRDMAEKRAE